MARVKVTGPSGTSFLGGVGVLKGSGRKWSAKTLAKRAERRAATKAAREAKVAQRRAERSAATLTRRLAKAESKVTKDLGVLYDTIKENRSVIKGKLRSKKANNCSLVPIVKANCALEKKGTRMLSRYQAKVNSGAFAYKPRA